MTSRGRLRQPPNLEWKPGDRQLPAAAVAVAVTPVAVAIPVAVRGIAVAVRGIAVAVAVRGIAVAIPAIRAVTIAVAVIIGGGLGGGEAGRAERGGGGDRDEGFLEGVHVHLLQKSVEPCGATNEGYIAQARTPENWVNLLSNWRGPTQAPYNGSPCATNAATAARAQAAQTPAAPQHVNCVRSTLPSCLVVMFVSTSYWLALVARAIPGLAERVGRSQAQVSQSRRRLFWRRCA